MNVEHVGLPVHGYQTQPDAAVAIVNNMKIAEEHILRMLDTLPAAYEIDPRWLAIGRTHIEQGFMAINRSVFKPKRLTTEQTLPENILQQD